MKISMVCPTFNRFGYLMMAIRCFKQQTYSNKELIIVDDSTEFPLLNLIEYNIRLIHLKNRTPTGTKRNIGAEAATGDIIANLDDDDWSASYRLEDQVQRLLNTGKAVTGYNSTVVYDEATGLFYKNMGGPPYYASGTSQCYLKEFWRAHPYPDVTYGEDSVFSRTARLADQLAIADVGKTMVARKHKNNTDPVILPWLKKWPADDVSPEFFSTLKDQFVPASREEAEAQFVAPMIVYHVSSLPEVKTR